MNILELFFLVWVLTAATNYVYLYIATKFGLFRKFTEWLTEDENYWGEKKYTPLWWFFVPPLCIVPFFSIVLFFIYKMFIKPLYQIFIRPIVNIIHLFYSILVKPIKKNMFYSEL